MTHALLLDLDDTLIDHKLAINTAAAEILESFEEAAEASASEFVASWHKLNTYWYDRYYEGEISFNDKGRAVLRASVAQLGIEIADEQADGILAKYLNRYITLCRKFNDVDPLLGNLSELKIAIVTNGETVQQMQKIELCDLADSVDAIVVSDAVGCTKPDARIFRYAATKLGVDVENCVFVGDNPELDARASTAIGMRGIWLNRDGADSNSGLETIATLDQLPDVIGKPSS